MYDDLDVDLDELDFDAELDVYMYGEDGSGGQADADRIAAWDDFHDTLQDDPLNADGVDTSAVSPMYEDYAFESELDVDRRLAGARMDSEDRA